MKTIGYIRVSTQEQAKEGISLENQKVKIESYCSLHNLNLLEVVEDPGKSGKDLNREGMCELLQRVKDKTIGAIVVYKLDRLSRKVLDTLTIIELFEKRGIVSHSIMEKIDTQSASGRFFLNITASLAQMERDLISERTKDALQLKISNNERAGQIPYGWKLDKDGRTLVEDERRQLAIQVARKMRKKRCTYQAICDELTKRGFEPLGQAWYPTTVKNMLNRSSYL